MKKRTLSTNSSRRSALKTLGMASAATLTAPFLTTMSGSVGSVATAGTFIGRRRDLRLAVLMPGTQGVGTASFNNGINLALEMAGTTAVRARVHDIGGGVSCAVRFAREQAANRDADVAIGLMSPRVARWLDTDLEQARLPLIVAGAGERAVSSDAVSPAFVYTTLQLTSAAYAAGAWAANNLGRSCALAASYYEAGYDIVHAFGAGFQAAGGTVISSYISGSPVSTVTAHDVVRAIAESKADVVGAFYNGAEAAEFFARYASYESTAYRPVVGSALVSPTQTSGIRLMSGTTWSAALDNVANRAFVDAYTARFAQAPDSFALLGYESAQRAIDAYDRGGRDGVVEALRSSASNAQVAVGARGMVAVNKGTNEISAPVYLRRFNSDGTEEMVAELSTADQAQKIAAQLPQRSGWITSYLTV